MHFPVDSFEHLHYDMFRAQQAFGLGSDTILKGLDNSQEAIKYGLPNFLGYCQAWIASIGTHLDSEAQIVFPFLSQKMDFEPEKEANKVIHKGLSDLAAIITQAKDEPSKYDPNLVKKHLVKLRDLLSEHLDTEVEHVKSSNLREAGFVKEELDVLTQRLGKYAQCHGDPFLVVPYMRSHTPPEFKNVWPPLPWVIRKVIIPYFLARKHSGYWKYAPYSVS